MFSDPMKLLPLVIAIGAIVLQALGKIDAQQMLTILGVNQIVHAGISSVNNSSAPNVEKP